MQPKWHVGFPGESVSKESACQCRRHGFEPCVGKVPWRRKWEPTAVFLPGKSHGQSSLAGYCPWGHRESDTTERLSTHTRTRQSSSPLFVKVQDDPQALTSFGNFLNIILSRDFQNLSKFVLQLGGFPLGQPLLPARQEEERDILHTRAHTHPVTRQTVKVQVYLPMCQVYFRGRTL